MRARLNDPRHRGGPAPLPADDVEVGSPAGKGLARIAGRSKACRSGKSGLQLVGAVPCGSRVCLSLSNLRLYFKMHSEGEFCEEAEYIEARAEHF